MIFRTMINMFDTNQTGTIDMNEFGRLFAYIQQWKAMFENFDRDRLENSDHDGDNDGDHDDQYDHDDRDDHDDHKNDDHDESQHLADIQHWKPTFENFEMNHK